MGRNAISVNKYYLIYGQIPIIKSETCGINSVNFSVLDSM